MLYQDEFKIKVLNKQSVNFLLFYAVISLLYPFLVFSSDNKWTLINFFLYINASFIFLFCFFSIKNNKLESWSLFGFVYFFALWLNTFQISSLQISKSATDLYTICLGPILFLCFLNVVERIKVAPLRVHLNFINLNNLYLVFIVLYISLSFSNAMKVGWRFDAIRTEHRIISGDEFVVPFFSGLWVTLSWILIILSQHVKKKYAFLAVISVCLFSGILHVKRGDLIRIFLFLIICFISSKTIFKQSQYLKKYIFIFLISCTIVVFVLFGQWRLAQSGNSFQTIIDITGVRLNNVYLAWLFAYLIVQFDVFSLSVSSLQLVPYSMIDVHILLNSIWDGGYNTLVSINGFNAGTGFWSFYRDMGNFFLLEMTVFLLLISMLIYLCKKTSCTGAYYFTCLLCALMVFGNYFCNRSMVLAIIFSNIIYLVSKRDVKNGCS